MWHAQLGREAQHRLGSQDLERIIPRPVGTVTGSAAVAQRVSSEQPGNQADCAAPLTAGSQRVALACLPAQGRTAVSVGQITGPAVGASRINCPAERASIPFAPWGVEDTALTYSATVGPSQACLQLHPLSCQAESVLSCTLHACRATTSKRHVLPGSPSRLPSPSAFSSPQRASAGTQHLTRYTAGHGCAIAIMPMLCVCPVLSKSVCVGS